jgi:hypothetical protein
VNNYSLPATTFVKASTLKRWVPRFLKRSARDWLQNGILKRAIREIEKLPAGQVPSRPMLENLQRGWANDGFAAQFGYLEKVAQTAATTAGPILECGSGLTTILMGLLAGRRGVQLWSLEHIPEWRARVTSVMERFAIPNVTLCDAPLRSYGEFSWYDAPREQMPKELRLVICDGPPGDTPGGRYGLLPLFREHLAAGCVILLDDATRPGELEVIRKWQKEARLRISASNESGESFAVITLE